jgi:two-component system, NarL family, nitrate/nitrite response regulator NarL
MGPLARVEDAGPTAPLCRDQVPATCNARTVCACHPAEVSLRCLLVDDNAPFLEAAASLLEREGLMVVGAASDITDALRKAQELRPDVVLVDITLGPESGFDLARRLADRDPGGAAIILISTHAEADFADLIEQAPVAGFLSKAELSANEIQRLAQAC